MQRLHISVATTEEQLEESIQFYTTLFNHVPTKRRDGYAKWYLDDPRVNFVVEAAHCKSDRPGVHHVGIETEDEGELSQLKSRLDASEAPLLDIGETVCCFSKSDKAWTKDPNGVRWEAFRSFGDTDHYGARCSAEERQLTIGCSTPR